MLLPISQEGHYSVEMALPVSVGLVWGFVGFLEFAACAVGLQSAIGVSIKTGRWQADSERIGDSGVRAVVQTRRRHEAG